MLREGVTPYVTLYIHSLVILSCDSHPCWGYLPDVVGVLSTFS